MINLFDIASIREIVEKYGSKHERNVWQTLEDVVLTQQTNNKQSMPCFHEETEEHRVELCIKCSKVVKQYT